MNKFTKYSMLKVYRTDSALQQVTDKCLDVSKLFFLMSIDLEEAYDKESRFALQNILFKI